MKAFDRFLIIILAWLSILNLCALEGTRTAGSVAIFATAVCFIFAIYENRISYYENKAERYKKMFMEQNKQYIKAVSELEVRREKSPNNIEMTVFNRAGQKQGIDCSKIS